MIRGSSSPLRIAIAIVTLCISGGWAVAQMVQFPAQGDEEVLLEGLLTTPPQDQWPCPGVVICHPDPRMNGSMYDAVVVAACEAWVSAGVATLAFNFRGVGQSTGEFDNGVGEVDDALGALGFLAEQEGAPSVDPQRLFLAGYSFGSVIALKAAMRDERVKGWVGLCFPFGSRTAEPGEYDWVKEVEALPMAFISGDQDVYSDLERIRSVAADIEPPPQFILIRGADHFFHGPAALLEQATQAAAEFLSTLAAPEEPAAPQ